VKVLVENDISWFPISFFLFKQEVHVTLIFTQTVCKTLGYSLTLWRLGGFGDFRKKTTAVFGCLTNALAPRLIALESCSTAQTDRPV